MTFRELLTSLGVAEDVIANIEKAMSENHFTTEQNMDIRYQKQKEQLAEANALIEEMKKNSGNTEEMQKKISEYENTVKNLNAQLEKAKIDSAIKVALLEAKATDIDYMSYKLREKGEIKLDEKGNIKDLDNLIKDLKAAHPTQFETAAKPKIDLKKLETGDDGKGGENTITKEQFEKMGYSSRIKLFKDNPELYRELTGKTNTDTTTEE